jgi:peptidyl-prolyl cis-trans isomerase A (cyclophilin A)
MQTRWEACLFLILFMLTPGAMADGVHSQKPQLEFQTNIGSFIVELYPDRAPKTVANFMQYVQSGFYTGTMFHRIIDRFMVQGGGFAADFQEKSTYNPIENEANNGLKNEPGTLAMARAFEPNSARSQFFINLSDNKFLNFYKPDPAYFGYCVFGKVIRGMTIVEKMAKIPTRSVGKFDNVPVENVVIEKVSTLDTPVEPEQPVRAVPTPPSSKPALKGKKRG